MKIALLTGGPSLERGISLNSARSVLDHLGNDNIEIVPIYFDQKKRAYKISPADLYSNTPSDFDFKLAQKISPLTEASLIKLLKSTDIVFPAMHGPFGEDGQIQAFLEKNNIPFIGSGSKACKLAFDKYDANKTIKDKGFFTLPVALLKIYSQENGKIIKKFFKENNIKNAIVKPASGGSSIGVFQVGTQEEALEKANLIFSKRMDTRVVLEPYAKGKEFTVIILENKLELPVALMATEIEAHKEGQIFDFRKKYLPTNQVKYHYPARFDLHITESILVKAEQIFKLFGMKDFARFDGWVLESGEIWFSDFNPISGMEQNSFLFQQTSRIGMSHGEILHFILRNSCKRQGVNFQENNEIERVDNKTGKKEVAVLFGGATSERQVSLMSGTNVWLKLRKSRTYNPTPYLLDTKGDIWSLPYSFILNHTVEEILENIKNVQSNHKKIQDLEKLTRAKLALGDREANEKFFLPQKITLTDFAKEHAFVFLGLHGGNGENGTMQKILSSFKTKYNGSGPAASHLCMDKFATGDFIRASGIKDVSIAPQKVVSMSQINSIKDFSLFWEKIKSDLEAKTIIVKPRSDGCSTGVVHLYKAEDFEKYFTFLKKMAEFIPMGTITHQDKIIELSKEKNDDILFEKFIQTDITSAVGNKIKYIRKSGFVEVTIGLLEEKGKMHAFYPSITIAEGDVLSLEEKFQGGTGVNLTPPPLKIAKPKAVARAKELAEQLAQEIGLKGYARIDAFMNVSTGKLMIIEVNTLPGLTPSTVFFHQGLSETPKIFPLELLEKIIKNAGY
jgi:D-alanine--D-alanine ligase